MIASTADATIPVDLDGTPIDPFDHGGLIGETIRRYYRPGMDREDLNQSGHLGLMEAYHRYDREFGCKFCTYAGHWIRRNVRLEALASGRALHLPSNVFEHLDKLHAGKDPREKRRILAATLASAVLAHAARSDRNSTAWLADYRERSPADVVADRATISQLLQSLTERERQIIVGLYGLDGKPPGNLTELGHEMGFSPQYARQLANQAMGKLRLAAKSDYKGSSKPWDGRRVIGAGARVRIPG